MLSIDGGKLRKKRNQIKEVWTCERNDRSRDFLLFTSFDVPERICSQEERRSSVAIGNDDAATRKTKEKNTKGKIRRRWRKTFAAGGYEDK